MKTSTMMLAFVVASISFLSGCATTMCVEEGTFISTPDGPRQVQTLKRGDQVWTLSPSGEREAGTIGAIATGRSSNLIAITAQDGELLRCTPEHLVATSHGWVKAAELNAREAVVIDSGSITVSVNGARVDNGRVFDLSVSPNQNYFANGFLVHNKTVIPRPTPKGVAGTYIGEISGFMYRLVLREDGSGEAGRLFFQGGKDLERLTRLLVLRSWEIREFNITIHLTDPATKWQYALQGTARGDRLSLRAVWPKDQSNEPARDFVREEVLQRQVAELQRVMSSPATP